MFIRTKDEDVQVYIGSALISLDFCKLSDLICIMLKVSLCKRRHGVWLSRIHRAPFSSNYFESRASISRPMDLLCCLFDSHEMTCVTVPGHGGRFQLLDQNPDHVDKDDNVDLVET